MKCVAAAWLISPIANANTGAIRRAAIARIERSISSPARRSIRPSFCGFSTLRPDQRPLHADTGGKITLDNDNTPTVNGNGAGFGLRKTIYLRSGSMVGIELDFFRTEVLRKIAMNQPWEFCI